MRAHPALVLNADFQPLSYFPLSLLRWDRAIKAVVEVRPAGRHSGEQVAYFVASRIARLKRPHLVEFTDALPRTADGAVDRDGVKKKWG